MIEQITIFPMAILLPRSEGIYGFEFSCNRKDPRAQNLMTFSCKEPLKTRVYEFDQNGRFHGFIYFHLCRGSIGDVISSINRQIIRGKALRVTYCVANTDVLDEHIVSFFAET